MHYEDSHCAQKPWLRTWCHRCSSYWPNMARDSLWSDEFINLTRHDKPSMRKWLAQGHSADHQQKSKENPGLLTVSSVPYSVSHIVSGNKKVLWICNCSSSFPFNQFLLRNCSVQSSWHTEVHLLKTTRLLPKENTREVWFPRTNC